MDSEKENFCTIAYFCRAKGTEKQCKCHYFEATHSVTPEFCANRGTGGEKKPCNSSEAQVAAAKNNPEKTNFCAIAYVCCAKGTEKQCKCKYFVPHHVALDFCICRDVNRCCNSPEAQVAAAKNKEN
ncbi:MAG: hypothetical protein PHT51_04980 [Patescibacteria group bacterium]|nr:hypothetical protein [Patescibacteria group bacterium]MDD4610718.1 hypothetical protein [Patescibacteria group bacterium]